MGTSVRMSLVRYIKQRIASAGKTVTEVADEAGISRNDLRSKLAGRGDLMVDDIAGIARVLNVEVAELVALSAAAISWDPATLADLTVNVVPDDRGRVLNIVEDDGQVFRAAFEIELSIEDLSATIKMFKGSASGDRDMAQDIIKYTQRKGMCSYWEQQESSGRWIVCTHFMVDRTEFPNMTFTDELRPCDDTACVDLLHEWQDESQFDSCSLERIEHSDGLYTVYGSRDHGEKWVAWADAYGMIEGQEGLKAARDLVNDFAWMQGECDRLNEAIR